MREIRDRSGQFSTKKLLTRLLSSLLSVLFIIQLTGAPIISANVTEAEFSAVIDGNAITAKLVNNTSGELKGYFILAAYNGGGIT